MSSSAVVANAPGSTLDAVLVGLYEKAKETRLNSRARNTLRAYASCFRSFDLWCRAHGLASLPAHPDTLIVFVEAEKGAGRKTATIATKLAAIRFVHTSANHPSPTQHPAVLEHMAGVRRQVGTAPVKKRAATADLLARMVEHIPADTLKGKRDRALLLMGFACAMRRSELVALNAADIEHVDQGARVIIRRSKTDQTGEGREIAVPAGGRLGVLEALEAWVDASGIADGALFRPIGKAGRLADTRLTDRSAAKLVKYYAAKAGLDPDVFAGHSLRAGFITSAAEAGAELSRIMEVSRHVEPKTVQGYIRRANPFRDHAGSSFL